MCPSPTRRWRCTRSPSAAASPYRSDRRPLCRSGHDGRASGGVHPLGGRSSRRYTLVELARMRSARRLAIAGALVACALALLTAGGSRAATPVGSPCQGIPTARCLTVTVPLDRTGRVPGKVGLHVEVLPPSGTPRGAVFLIAGGPGQAATQLFDFRQPLIGVLFQTAFPGYTIVTYDVRGTGRSGALRCPAVAILGPTDDKMTASCAASLGPRRDFYGTPDQAQDLEAVRQALGYDKVALSAVSYGTEL